MNIDETILSKLSDEMKKKVEAAKTPEELLALATKKIAQPSALACVQS